MKEWIDKGKWKYVFSFIKIFASEFVSFNELNMPKCMNIKIKGTNKSLLETVRDFSREIDIENFNQIIRLWHFIEVKDSRLVTLSFLHILEKCPDIQVVMTTVANFLCQIEFRIDDKLGQNFLLLDFTQILAEGNPLTKQKLIYLVMRDSKLFEMKDKIQRI